MIYTVTFNPAIDYVVRLDAPLEVGEVNRAKGEDCVLGGKGINVSGVLAELGCRNTALGFVAGETGAWLERGLAAQGITTDEDSEFTFTQLLTTGDTAYAMENYATAETAQKADTDPEGSFAVAVAAENAATGARVVWVNCPNLLLSSINQQVSGGNAQLLGSAVNWLNGAQTTAVINAKSMSAASLNVPVSAAVPLGVLFTLVLPIVCLIAGAVICVVRRRR